MADSPELIARTALEQLLKAQLGTQGVSMSSAVLQSAIDTALDDLSRLIPLVSYAEVNLIPNQAEYAVPVTTYSVLDVVFPSYALPEGLDSLEGDSAIDQVEYSFHSHSMAVIDAQKWEQFENLYGYDWEYDIDRNTIIVVPAPKMAGKMLVKLSGVRTLSGLPLKLRTVAQELALAESLRVFATTIGSGITSIPIGIGSVSFNAQMLQAESDVLRSKALAKVGTQGGAVIIG